MRDVVTRCLQKDPKKRPTATELLQHKFFRVSTTLVSSCLGRPPHPRRAAEERAPRLPCLFTLLRACLLQQAKDEEYLKREMLKDLPTLEQRVNQIRTGQAATNAVDNDRELEKSQQVRRGRCCPGRWIDCCLGRLGVGLLPLC
jgi:serine/threonine-protein kinase OSR1/STK39